MSEFNGPTMLAAQYDENTEDLNALQLRQVEKPAAKEGYIVVRNHSASINPIDTMVMKGFAKAVLHWDMPLPFVMGYDFAGVVDSVGSGVAGFSVGDRVFGVNWGTHKHVDPDCPAGGSFAEYISIPASKASKLPENVTYDQGAAIALIGTTAYQILFNCAKVKAGDKVLILGGSTAVGSVAIQLAKSRGAWVATTCSTRTLAFVNQFGADLVINYNEAKWDQHDALKGIDAVLDCVGEAGAWGKASQGVVKADGAFVSITNPEAGFNPAGHPPMHFASIYTFAHSAAVQDELAAMLAAGTLKITISETFPFTQEGVHALARKINSGTSTGKNVLHIVQ